ncbi:hypothetical protein PoB_002981000 [Plakobranchus ocellatus]|uniref:Uncharacterized protein n=1 Tax=Plakobranchus ocellatus TaxID=259542 RepID=A0AAV4A7E3_9GAST|nr:hypothetical protein PoB_002981000 [Plakobranchus ocellatus]
MVINNVKSLHVSVLTESLQHSLGPSTFRSNVMHQFSEECDLDIVHPSLRDSPSSGCAPIKVGAYIYAHKEISSRAAVLSSSAVANEEQCSH